MLYFSRIFLWRRVICSSFRALPARASHNRSRSDGQPQWEPRQAGKQSRAAREHRPAGLSDLLLWELLQSARMQVSPACQHFQMFYSCPQGSSFPDLSPGWAHHLLEKGKPCCERCLCSAPSLLPPEHSQLPRCQADTETQSSTQLLLLVLLCRMTRGSP